MDLATKVLPAEVREKVRSRLAALMSQAANPEGYSRLEEGLKVAAEIEPEGLRSFLDKQEKRTHGGADRASQERFFYQVALHMDWVPLDEQLKRTERLIDAIQFLDQRETYIILSRYLRMKSWDEISAETDLNRTTLHRIHRGALERLRSHWENQDG